MAITTTGAVALFTRAWIEIPYNQDDFYACFVALFTRAWIEMIPTFRPTSRCSVALFTRAWIEMLIGKGDLFAWIGRPLYEGVD